MLNSKFNTHEGLHPPLVYHGLSGLGDAIRRLSIQFKI